MTPLDDINFEELERQLDPGTRIVFSMLRKSNKELLSINNTLTEQISSQTEQISSQTEQITNLTEQIEDLRHMLFGRKSEKMPSMQNEVRRAVEESELFGEPDSVQETETGSDISTNERRKEEQKKARRRRKARAKSEKKRKDNRKLKKNLPVVHETVEVTQEQLPEGYTLDDFREVGADKGCNIVCRVDHVREHLVVVHR